MHFSILLSERNKMKYNYLKPNQLKIHATHPNKTKGVACEEIVVSGSDIKSPSVGVIPYNLLKAFEVLCETLRLQGVPFEAMLDMRLSKVMPNRNAKQFMSALNQFLFKIEVSSECAVEHHNDMRRAADEIDAAIDEVECEELEDELEQIAAMKTQKIKKKDFH